MNTLEEYGNLFSKLGLTELSVKEGHFELTLKKETPAVTPSVSAQPVVNAVPVAEKNSEVSEEKEQSKRETATITSPLVGVFWAGENPDVKPYVEVGDTVKKGDVVCTIEAMKMFNDVTADKDGVIKEICVQNGQLVEYKQVLFKLERSAE